MNKKADTTYSDFPTVLFWRVYGKWRETHTNSTQKMHARDAVHLNRIRMTENLGRGL